MKNILEKFALGKISPPFDGYRKDPQSRHTFNTYLDIEDKLMAMLDGEAKIIFEKYVKVQAEAMSMNETDKFIYGYRLGVLMTMEVFNDKEEADFGGILIE
ncbi:MAG: hypothetical protein FWE20_02065 [Defluviitaleaceae bacterium]|nr:hypothetical protein [Defluviitaleaceae bacterium]